MTAVTLIESVRRELLADSELDYLGLGQVAFQVGEALGLESPSELRSVTLSILESLLDDHLIEAGMPEGMDKPGTPAPDGENMDEWLARTHQPVPGEWQFDAWPGSPSEIVGRIRNRWSAPSDDTDLDTICWFRATGEGRRKAIEWKTERDDLL
jgi:hypothetical protein